MDNETEGMQLFLLDTKLIENIWKYNWLPGNEDSAMIWILDEEAVFQGFFRYRQTWRISLNPRCKVN